MNKPSLNEDAQQALTIRTFIASTTDIMTKTDIAEGFGISRQTLYRYGSPELQDSNRANSRKQYKRREVNPTHCGICQAALRKHPRCSNCDILLHDMDTECLGRSMDMDTCYDCLYG